jgi:predicted nuclease of predicted toxin-antitoxin system
MKLYLDDDMAAPLLARLLRNAGHDVLVPADAGRSGDDDPVHFRHAAMNGRAIITGNHDDFENLHELVVDLGGHHSGVLAVRKDNDPNRDLKAAGIVRAVRNLLAANAPIADQFIILNHWR